MQPSTAFKSSSPNYIYDLKISRKLWDEMPGRYRNYHQNRIIESTSKKYHNFVDNMQIIQGLR